MAGCCVCIFPARLNVEDIAGVLRRGPQLAASLDELPKIIRISDALKVASVNRFRFIVLGNGDRFESFVARCHVNIAAHKVHEVRALQQKLRHPGVVIVLSGNVAIATLPRFSGSHRVRDKSGKRLS